MKNNNAHRLIYLLITFFCLNFSGYSQMMFTQIVPENTATHIAVKNGNWGDTETWNSGSIPGLASIVIIPQGININYNVNRDAHIFIIRNEGTITFNAPNGVNRKLRVDTFLNGMMSKFLINADKSTDGNIEILFEAFDIEAKKSGSIGGSNWPNEAKNHYSDGKPVFDHFGTRLNDGSGVLGRYEWDPGQRTLGIMSMNEVKIFGQDKTDFLRTTKMTRPGANSVTLEEAPVNWNNNDIVVLSGTRGIRNFDAQHPNGTQDEEFTITVDPSDDRKINFNSVTKYRHEGIAAENLFCHLSNLTRNVVFKSINFGNKITKRGHVMFMRTTNVKIHNSLFKDLGRSDKHNILDDFKFTLRQNGTDSDGKPKVRIRNFREEPADPKDIQNQRGRYAMHFHRMKDSETLIAEAHGNVVWGSPGWGMVHHDSHASFVDNVVYDVVGSGMVSESGSETGIWKNNIVTTARPDEREFAFSDMNRDAVNSFNGEISKVLDDDFRIGEAYGLQGRAVRMINNVAASSREAYAYDGDGFIPSIRDDIRTNVYPIDMFPLQSYVDRAAVPLLEFNNNESYGCDSGFRSKNRASQAYHHVLSIIDNHIEWNVPRALYITNNFGYMVRNARFYNGSRAGLVAPNLDNLNMVNCIYRDWSLRGFDSARDVINPNAKMNFINVQFPGFNQSKIFKDLTYGGHNVYGTEVFTPDNVTIQFTPGSQMNTTVNVNTNNFKVIVAGQIKDRLGSYPFGHKYASPFSNINKRVYDFINEETLETYLDKYGVYEDASGKYTIINEFISDRATGETQEIEFRIDLIGVDYEPTENNAPVINVLKPLDTDEYFAGDNIIIRADVTDPDDNIKEVRLYLNGELIRTDTEGPFGWGGNSKLQNLEAGNYRFRLVAIDDDGNRARKMILVKVLPESFKDSDFSKENAGAILVTPNPTAGSNVNIYQKGNQYLRLYNILGEKIKDIDITAKEFKLDISGMASGLYILKSDKSSAKFIIE